MIRLTILIYNLMFFCLIIGFVSAQDNPTGLAIAIVPSASYTTDEGFEYGGKFFTYQFGDGEKQPYLWNMTLNAFRTTKEKNDFYVFGDMPHFAGKDNLRIITLVEFISHIREEYYGLGNRPVYKKAYNDPSSPFFQSKEYYNYKHKWTSLLLNVQLPVLGKQFKTLFGIGLFNTQINGCKSPNQFLFDNPYGCGGGRTNFIQIGLLWDSRDQEAAPSAGFWTDLLIEKTFRSMQSDYDYLRLTLSDRRYHTITRNVVFAQRIIYEAMFGRPPFYEMSVINSSQKRFVGIGGSSSMRGIPRMLFVGPDKLLGNFELRWKFARLTLLKQTLTFYTNTFIDAGKVWMNRLESGLKFMHFSYGLGLHVQWKKDFIGAIDIGRSPYLDHAIYITFGNLF